MPNTTTVIIWIGGFGSAVGMAKNRRGPHGGGPTLVQKPFESFFKLALDRVLAVLIAEEPGIHAAPA